MSLAAGVRETVRGYAGRDPPGRAAAGRRLARAGSTEEKGRGFNIINGTWDERRGRGRSGKGEARKGDPAEIDGSREEGNAR